VWEEQRNKNFLKQQRITKLFTIPSALQIQNNLLASECELLHVNKTPSSEPKVQ
jgi:hypothetical protein